MPRLSIKEQRAKEIVSAFERCIVRNGINGAQLEKIAAESGIQRPALRHFIGNREELIYELTKSIAQEYTQMLNTAGKLLDQVGSSPDDLLLLMFMQSRLTTPERIIVFVNLYSISHRYPYVKKLLTKWYLDYVDWVALQLGKFKPKASKRDLEKTAIALVSMSFNFASLAPLEIEDADVNHILAAGSKLIKALKG
jgi:AcrR family transcriptional regulator